MPNYNTRLYIAKNMQNLNGRSHKSLQLSELSVGDFVEYEPIHSSMSTKTLHRQKGIIYSIYADGLIGILSRDNNNLHSWGQAILDTGFDTHEMKGLLPQIIPYDFIVRKLHDVV